MRPHPRLLLAALLLVASLPLLGGHLTPHAPTPAPQPTPAKPPPAIRPLPTPQDAVRAALADAATLPPGVAPLVRYLWFPTGDNREAKAASLALNIVSRAPVLRRPPGVPGLLLRVDLRHYAPRAEDLAEWLKFWEDFQFDPWFALLITKDVLNNLTADERAVWMARRRGRVAPAPVVIPDPPRTQDRSLGWKGCILATVPDGALITIDGEPTTSTGTTRRFITPPLQPTVSHFTLRATFDGRTITRRVAVEGGCVSRVSFDFAPVLPPVVAVKDVELVRLDSPAIDPAAFTELQRLTQSNAPVVSVPYFMQRALTTVKDKGVYAQIFGGRYYELAGVRRAKDVKGKEKATDEDLFLESLGVGNIKAGLTAEKLFDQLRSDQRIAVFRSNVTGKPRRVDMFHSLAGRESMGWVAITHDLRDQDVDVASHPIMNLLKFQDQAREDIADKANGLHIYALFDGKGARLDEAAPDVAADRTIPAPNSTRLQSALSCIACHEADGSDGWKPLGNDVRRLLSGKLDVFADLTDRNALVTDTIDRLAGLYSGDFTRNLTRARDDFALATLKASGPWADSGDQVAVVKAATGYLVERTRGYQLGMVDAAQALRELGLEVPKEKAVAVLRLVLPPDPESRIGDIFPEDPRLGALKESLSISRVDWSLTHGFAARRAQKALAAYRRKGK